MPVSVLVVFSSAHEGFTHSVDIFGAFVLSLTHVDVGDYFFPSCFFVELGPLCSHLFLLTNVICCSFFFFFLFPVSVLFQLLPTLFLSLFLFFPLLILSKHSFTLFCLRTVCILSYYYRILRVTSSSSKSLKSSPPSALLLLLGGYQL